MIQALGRYLQNTLGLHVDPKPLKDVGDLPLFLLDYYIFYTASLLGKPCVLAVARESDTITPAAIRKHLDILQTKTKVTCIYISDSAASYNRKRLIAHRVQFVIPNRQIYLPALGIDWIENSHISPKHRGAAKYMTPSTQAVVIYALMRQGENEFIPLKLAKILNYTPMTMTRAFNELESFNLGKTFRKGKERRFTLENHSLLWEKSQPLMRNPVKSRVWLKVSKGGIQEIKRLGILAGLSALGELSMLSLPAHPVYAISKQTWKRLQKSGGVEEIPSAEDADIEIEVWSYDPKLCASKGHVDLFSLFLSLRENQDERVEAALEGLMKEIK